MGERYDVRISLVYPRLLIGIDILSKFAHARDVMTGVLRSKKIKIMQICIAILEHIGWIHNIFTYRLQRKGV